MDLKAKMPAQQDSTLSAKMPATMASQAEATGGGSTNNPQGAISQETGEQDASWASTDQGTQGWEATDRKSGNAWELTDTEASEPAEPAEG